MKVCVATTSFPRWEGDGQGAFVWEAVRALAEQGHEMRVVAMHAPGLPVRSHHHGIPVFRPRYWWPERQEMLKRDGGGLPIVWQRRPWARLQVFPFGIAHARAIAAWSRDCDLVHAEWTLSAAAAAIGKPLHHHRVLATLQGSDLFRVTTSAAGRTATKLALRGCDRVTVLSQALAQRAIALGVPQERLDIIPNGVDTRVFTPLAEEDREEVALFVGSLIPRKGPEYLLAALPAILARRPRLRLVLIGDGPQEGELKAQVERLGVGHSVSFLGFLTQADVRVWMRRARVFVLPSIEEGLGVVLLEALATGTPIVASNVDGIPDVVTKDVGALVPARSAEALAGAILETLRDSTRWRELSANARQRAECTYDWQHIAASYTAVYRRLVQG
jgi:glycosyltransferase involved in cell wall biosynthesis